MAKKVIRLDKESSDGVWIQPDSRLTGDIRGYFGRTTSRDQIKSKIKRRYGSEVQLRKDEVSGVVLGSTTSQIMSAQMSADQIEVVSIELGHKMTAALATLFSEDSQDFVLVPPVEVDVSMVKDVLFEARGQERFESALTQADEEAVQQGSSVLFAEWRDGGLHYRTIDPGKVQAFFDSSVISDGEPRSVNYLDPEDATCIIVETGCVDGVTHNYTAIFGRSARYPYGRYVHYSSQSDGQDIPDVGDPDSFEYLSDGAPANPLSLYASQAGGLNVPEYPIVIFLGGHVRHDTMLPISGTLLDESLEADVAASHIRSTSGDNATGTRCFYKSPMGGVQTPPDSLIGNVICEDGQRVEIPTADAQGPRIAWELLDESNVSSAAGRGVPNFWVAKDEKLTEASSGVALQIRAMPLSRVRRRRIKINAPAVQRLFEIERAYCVLFADAPDEVKVLLERCEQRWDPGMVEYPENELDRIQVMERKKAIGVWDTIELIKYEYKVTSDEEAIAIYEQLKKRGEEYPPLNQDTSVDTVPGDEGVPNEKMV